ncbi:tetratricopeptide repeat protein [Streptomyces sp. NPDC057743]|uniref:tetratricopeptide repeat protein n=1 Tax=Streptomyces sp. NPDC057743 TaxID=3346236 RepID=UPI0036BEB2BA
MPTWQILLRELMENDSGAAAEIRSLVDELPAPAPAEPQGPARAPAAVRNLVSGGTVHGPIVQAGAISALTFHTTAYPGALPDPESWPTAGDVDPIALGVRPAHRVPDHPPLPPYVPRDHDHELDEALGAARAEGGLVLLLGEPFTGKSRTALAALARGPAGRRVFAPARGTDLRGLPVLLQGRSDRYVVWLDDLDGHLGDSGGLEPRLLAQLAALRVVVLATMREDAYDDCRNAPRGRVLDLAHTVELGREWSLAERYRLAAEAAGTGDPRLLDAAAASGPEGAPAYLSLSPLLWEEWWRARRADRHPRGHALVRAALDLARCGLTGPLTMDLLLKVHEGYDDVPGMERESVADAQAWAIERRHGLLRLLDRASGDTWRAAPFLIAAAARRQLPPVSGPVWGCALEAARTDAAHDYAEIMAKARAAFERAAEEGDNRALHNLGVLAEARGEPVEAERWFRRAADAGEARSAARLGRLLAERGEDRAAEPFLETAAEAGDADAATLLGKLLRERAQHWLGAAAEAGNAEAAHLHGDLLLGSGDDKGAFRSYLTALKANYEPVAASYAALLIRWSERTEAVLWLRRAVDRGDERAAQALEYLADPLSGIDTEQELREGVEDGEKLVAANLGRLLESRNRLDEARTWYLAGYEQGDAYAAFRLAELHKKAGEDAEATAWYRKAAAMGHPGARRALGES